MKIIISPEPFPKIIQSVLTKHELFATNISRVCLNFVSEGNAGPHSSNLETNIFSFPSSSKFHSDLSIHC